MPPCYTKTMKKEEFLEEISVGDREGITTD